MARYSSDSDSDRSNRHRRKHYRRSRSSSSHSSDSSSYKKRLSKHSRSKRRHRTRSKSRERDRASKSYKSTRGSSKDRDKRRYRSKKSKSYSPDRSNRRKVRSPSREKSTSRSSSAQSSAKPINEKPTSLVVKDEFSIEPRIKESILDEINSESFAPRAFTSSASSKDNKFKNVVIDVSSETIQAPAVRNPINAVESIFHTSIMMDQEARFDKWVKKLYTLRQKAIIDVTHTNVT